MISQRIHSSTQISVILSTSANGNFASGQWLWNPCHWLWCNLEMTRRFGGRHTEWDSMWSKRTNLTESGKICQSTVESINPGLEGDDKVVKRFSNILLYFPFPHDLCFRLCWLFFGMFQQGQMLAGWIDLRKTTSSASLFILEYIPSVKIYCHVLCACSDWC